MKSAFLTPLAAIPADLTARVMVSKGRASRKIEALYAIAMQCEPREAPRAIQALSIRGGSFTTAKGVEIARLDAPFEFVQDGVRVVENTYAGGLREIAAYGRDGKTVVAVASRQKDVTRWACYGSAKSRPDLLTKTRKIALAFIVNAARKAESHA